MDAMIQESLTDPNGTNGTREWHSVKQAYSDGLFGQFHVAIAT